MKIQIYILILSLNFGCSGQPENSINETLSISEKNIEYPDGLMESKNKNPIHNLKQLSIVEESKNYKTVKEEILILRNQLESKGIEIDSFGKYFKESLLNKIIPFWEGTSWSFEGHTSKPGIGEIACGYFVSTTLKDIGLNLNRYSLAQQSPINEAKSLALNSEVKEFSEKTNLENISAMKKYLKEGIHFIGFDQSHVGFILKEKDNLYLIHSNYMDEVGVEIEQIEESEVFKSYSKLYIVELSTNKHLLAHWGGNKRIEITK